jgi:hypothetical protein
MALLRSINRPVAEVAAFILEYEAVAPVRTPLRTGPVTDGDTVSGGFETIGTL